MLKRKISRTMQWPQLRTSSSNKVHDWLKITNRKVSIQAKETLRTPLYLIVKSVKQDKMSFGIELYPSLACVLLGACLLLIMFTAICIKILEWQHAAQQMQAFAEHGEERILPIQEEGDEAVGLHRRRLIQIRPRKLPCQHEETHREI